MQSALSDNKKDMEIILNNEAVVRESSNEYLTKSMMKRSYNTTKKDT